jgi:uncharacterized protein
MSSDSGFLGRGWAFPPRFGLGGSQVHTVAGLEDIGQSLAILLATRPGERVMQDDFGCDLGQFLFEEVTDGLIGRLRSVVEDAILHHEPRVRLDEVEVDADEVQSGLLHIVIRYTVRATNSRYNMVYPFYLTEATAPDR